MFVSSSAEYSELWLLYMTLDRGLPLELGRRFCSGEGEYTAFNCFAYFFLLSVLSNLFKNIVIFVNGYTGKSQDVYT